MLVIRSPENQTERSSGQKVDLKTILDPSRSIPHWSFVHWHRFQSWRILPISLKCYQVLVPWDPWGFFPAIFDCFKDLFLFLYLRGFVGIGQGFPRLLKECSQVSTGNREDTWGFLPSSTCPRLSWMLQAVFKKSAFKSLARCSKILDDESQWLWKEKEKNQ